MCQLGIGKRFSDQAKVRGGRWSWRKRAVASRQWGKGSGQQVLHP